MHGSATCTSTVLHVKAKLLIHSGYLRKFEAKAANQLPQTSCRKPAAANRSPTPHSRGSHTVSALVQVPCPLLLQPASLSSSMFQSHAALPLFYLVPRHAGNTTLLRAVSVTPLPLFIVVAITLLLQLRPVCAFAMPTSACSGNGGVDNVDSNARVFHMVKDPETELGLGTYCWKTTCRPGTTVWDLLLKIVRKGLQVERYGIAALPTRVEHFTEIKYDGQAGCTVLTTTGNVVQVRVCCVFAASAWLAVCVRGAVIRSAL